MLRMHVWLWFSGVLFALGGPGTPVQAEGELLELAEGPWGRIEYYETFIEPPAEYVDALAEPQPARWIFQARDRSESVALMLESGVSADLLALIADARFWQPTPLGVQLSPTDEFVLGMGQDVRTRLYAHLFDSPPGQLSAGAYSLEQGNWHEEVAADLPEDLRRLVYSLSYRWGEMIFISDLSVALRQVEDDALRRKMVQAIVRARNLLPRLRVDERSDIDSLVEYWSGPEPTVDLRAMLKSVQNQPGVSFIDLIHLLPALPRKYLGSYFHTRDAIFDQQPDCFWAAASFFEPAPNPRILDGLPIPFYLNPSRFEQLASESPLRFGDVCVLCKAGSEDFVHAFVHVAADLVFTKNGHNPFSPWVFARKTNMMARYNVRGPFDESAYRRLPRAPILSQQ